MRDPNDGLTPEEIAALDKYEAKQASERPRTSTRLLAKFGHHFGWAGVEAALQNRIPAYLFMDLLREAEKLERERSADLLVDIANGSRAGVVGGRRGDDAINRIAKERRR